MVKIVQKIFVYSLFLLFLSTSIFANEQPISLEYSIRPLIENEKSALEVSLAFQGNESGTSEILLPSSWAGKDELYLEISKLDSLSPDVKIENTDQPEVKKVHHLPNERIQIRYHVTSREKQESGWYYRPVVKQSHFFFIGHCFFIIPRIDAYTTAHITLEWQDFRADWALANSFGAQQRKQEITTSLAKFRHTVHVGGDFQILQCGDPKSPIFVAIRKGWSFSNEHLTHLIQTVIESHREFWNDHNFPHYLITVLSTEGDYRLGGTGLVNSFSLFLRDFPEKSEENWQWLAWLLSHEHFHNWNGIKMMSGPPTPEGSLYWFTEGFTEYYAVKLNRKTHLMNIDEYLDHMNAILYDYYDSPVHNEKNERVQQDFWNNQDVQRLPYVRGFLFAWQWDKKMQQVSDGKYCLDDFMLALFKRTQEEHKSLLSQEVIEQTASLFLPPQMVQEDIKSSIIDGKTIFPEDESEIYVKWMEPIGFNVQRALSKGKIDGVKQDSKAFEAGLRNGQKFLRYQCTDQFVSVFIVSPDGNTKELTYVKEPTGRLIPHYELREDLTKLER